MCKISFCVLNIIWLQCLDLFEVPVFCMLENSTDFQDKFSRYKPTSWFTCYVTKVHDIVLCLMFALF